MVEIVAWCRRSNLFVVLFCMVQLVVEMFAGRLQVSIPFMLHGRRRIRVSASNALLAGSSALERPRERQRAQRQRKKGERESRFEEW